MSRQLKTSRNPSLGAGALSKAFWRIVPLIGLGYGFAFIDRVNISFAAQQMNARKALATSADIGIA